MSRTKRPTKLPVSQSGRPPKVNLMPAVELERRAGRRLLRNWAFGLVATLAALALVVGVLFTVRVTADLRLAAEQRRTDTLAIELARYAEVSGILEQRSDLSQFRGEAASNDVAWTKLYADIAGALPSGVSVAGFVLNPGAEPASGAEPTTAIGITGTLTCRSADPADQRAAVVALRRIPGALAVDAGKLAFTEENGYEFEIAFVADQSRYTGRFAVDKGVK